MYILENKVSIKARINVEETWTSFAKAICLDSVDMPRSKWNGKR